jgi:hypothetical protein
MSGLPDGYFLRLKPADVITAVGTITLAEISKYTVAELLRIGWFTNPIIQELYILGNTGLWTIRPQDSNGRAPVVEENSSDISLTNSYLLNTSYVDGRPLVNSAYAQRITSSPAQKLSRALTWIPAITDGSGDVDDQEIVPALAGYYGVARLLYFIQQSGAAEQWAWFFHDEDDNALQGALDGYLYHNLVADSDYSPIGFGGDKGNDTNLQPVVWKGTDNKALEYDVTGQTTIAIGHLQEDWYET